MVRNLTEAQGVGNTEPSEAAPWIYLPQAVHFTYSAMTYTSTPMTERLNRKLFQYRSTFVGQFYNCRTLL